MQRDFDDLILASPIIQNFVGKVGDIRRLTVNAEGTGILFYNSGKKLMAKRQNLRESCIS